MELPIITAKEEGGYYTPDRDPCAVIRIYKDRRVQDDICTNRLGIKWRSRLTRKEFRHAKRAAKMNRIAGRV